MRENEKDAIAVTRILCIPLPTFVNTKNVSSTTVEKSSITLFSITRKQHERHYSSVVVINEIQKALLFLKIYLYDENPWCRAEK